MIKTTTSLVNQKSHSGQRNFLQTNYQFRTSDVTSDNKLQIFSIQFFIIEKTLQA